jgi:hypothetical protein
MKRGDVEGFVMAKKLVQHRLRRDYRKIIDNTKSIEQSWKDMMEFEEVDGKLMEDGSPMMVVLAETIQSRSS